MVQAFRELGPAYTAVATRVGRNPRTTKRAWEKGLRPSKAAGFKGIVPIRDTIAKEQVQARAALATIVEAPTDMERDEQLRLMAQQVLDARIKTGHVLRELKDSVATMAPGVKRLAAGAAHMCHKIGEMLGDLDIVVRAPAEDQISVSQAMWMLKDVAFMLATVTQTVRELNDMERLELGEPTEILGVKVTMSDAETKQFIIDAHAVFSTMDVGAFEPEEG